MHGPSDWASWIIYGGMGLIMGETYLKTKNIYASIATHALWNTWGFIGMLILLLTDAI